jgi:hypothetical protein
MSLARLRGCSLCFVFQVCVRLLTVSDRNNGWRFESGMEASSEALCYLSFLLRTQALDLAYSMGVCI